MILYLDASALVKRYVAEIGSAELSRMLSRAATVGTAVISRAEVAAALAIARTLAPPCESFAPNGQIWRACRSARSLWRKLMFLPGNKGCAAMTLCI